MINWLIGKVFPGIFFLSFLPELAVLKTIDLFFLEGLKTGFFVKNDMGETNEQR